ncbi:MAG: TRIC cation channel family protein [Clostridia bacterium]|nr:TRIC cation channel family protein [Clostridia bacterium]
MEVFLIIIQCIGAISFTISATIYAIHKRADIIGAIVFSLLTCFGGGLIRDIAIGNALPSILSDKVLIATAILSMVVSIICYHLGFIKRVSRFADRHQHSFLIEFTDSLGLASYVISGLEIAREAGHDGFVVLVFAGCITGVGGGILRDICSAEIPAVFRKHIYLIPVVIASVFFTLTYKHMSEVLCVIITMLIIIVIRMLAFKLKWNLPIPKSEEEKKEEKELQLK